MTFPTGGLRHLVRRALGRDREIVLAAVFLVMASYELIEMWALERPRSVWSLAGLIHALQVLGILAATGACLRAWRAKTAHEESLARMVEKVVFAQEEERRRIAYELHDGIAQLIVSAKQHLDTSADVWPEEPARASAELVTGLDRLERAIVETRRVLMALRPSAIATAGLERAVRQSLDEAAHESGFTVGLDAALGERPLPPAVETAAFRIVQEALANAARHARAPRVDVGLRCADGWLELEVRDDGIGFVPGVTQGRSGLGLTSMRERARLLGGTCRVESAPGRGARVQVRLPLALGTGHGAAR
jgi:two-component system, NarL family, sensor kinase